MPCRMVWINGHGCQRAFSYWYYAAGSVAFPKARQARCSFVSVLTSRIAGYVIRMSGGVGGALSDGCPYPYGRRLRDLTMFEIYDSRLQNFSKTISSHGDAFFSQTNWNWFIKWSNHVLSACEDSWNIGRSTFNKPI